MRVPFRFLLLILFLPCNAFAVDYYSEGKDLQTISDTSKLKSYLELSKKYNLINVDSALYFARQALSISELKNNPKNILTSYIELAVNYSKKGIPDSSFLFLNRANRIAIKTKDTLNICTVQSYFGGYYASINQYDSAIHYYQKSLDLCKFTKDEKIKAFNLIGLGIIFQERGNLEAALNKYLEAYAIVELLNEEILKAQLLMNMANIYADENQNKKAISIYNKILHIAKEEALPSISSSIYNNLAIIYQSEGSNQKALSYYKKSLNLELKAGKKKGISLAYNNIGDLYFSMGETEKAIEYLNKSLAYNRELNLQTEIIYNVESLARVYLHTKNYSKAYNYIKEGLEQSKSLKIKGKYSDLLELLSEYHFKTGDYKQAYLNLNKFNEVTDCLRNESRSNKIAQLQTMFETEKKEKENEILRVKNQYTQDKLEQQKTIKNFLIIFSILAIISLVLSYILFRSKVQANKKFKKVNAMLEESNQKLKVTNATKDKFFSIIAHDLRSPFNTILGFSELIKNEVTTGSKKIEVIQNYNNSINESAQNLFTLLENLLQWANSQRGELEFAPTQFDLFDLIQSNLTIFSLKASDKSISLISHIAPKTNVYGDINMVNTIVRNLISNALKFTHKGGKIQLSTTTKNGFVFLSVKDNGIGINKENQEKLFRLDCNFTSSGTNDEAGSGLGLLLCKEFVEKNGGSIWVESEVNKGSEFIFTLQPAN